MNKRGKSWHLIVTALLIVVFSFTALFGVSYTYGDTKNVYIKGAEDIRFGIDILPALSGEFTTALYHKWQDSAQRYCICQKSAMLCEFLLFRLHSSVTLSS